MLRHSFSYRRNNPGLEQAIIGTELLRLAGGPNRGWYPTRKANQPRPASIEHLERLNNAYDARLPGTGDQRKPLTLPTNITPNKYFGQSKHSSASSTREALRRVTSLLIKKGKRRRFALLKQEWTHHALNVSVAQMWRARRRPTVTIWKIIGSHLHPRWFYGSFFSFFRQCYHESNAQTLLIECWEKQLIS